MGEFLSMFEYSFIQNALIAGVLISIAAGIIGTLVVVNRMVFLAGGLAHASYGGIGIALYFSLPFFWGTGLYAVLNAIIIALASLYLKDRLDSIIGTLWAFGMALGIILTDLTPGYNVDMMSYLFGSILAVSNQDLIMMVGLDAILLFFVVHYYRPLLAISFDPEFAMLQGYRVPLFRIIMLILTALTIVVAIRVVGLILVIALLTIPTLLTERRAKNLGVMMVSSSLLALSFTLIGLTLSYYFDLTSGAAIIFVATLFAALYFGMRFMKGNPL